MTAYAFTTLYRIQKILFLPATALALRYVAYGHLACDLNEGVKRPYASSRLCRYGQIIG